MYIYIYIYIYKNRSGPIMDPWGTPINRSKNELYEELIFVLCFLLNSFRDSQVKP